MVPSPRITNRTHACPGETVTLNCTATVAIQTGELTWTLNSSIGNQRITFYANEPAGRLQTTGFNIEQSTAILYRNDPFNLSDTVGGKKITSLLLTTVDSLRQPINISCRADNSIEMEVITIAGKRFKL